MDFIYDFDSIFTIPFMHDVCWTFRPTSLLLYMAWMHYESHERSMLWIPYKLMSGSQLVHELRQSVRGYSALLPNWRDELSWSSRWGSHGKCTSVYGYTLDNTYDKSWH